MIATVRENLSSLPEEITERYLFCIEIRGILLEVLKCMENSKSLYPFIKDKKDPRVTLLYGKNYTGMFLDRYETEATYIEIAKKYGVDKNTPRYVEAKILRAFRHSSNPMCKEGRAYFNR